MKTGSDSRLACTFCGKSQLEVSRLLVGRSSYICNECVTRCAEVLNGDIKEQIGSVLIDGQGDKSAARDVVVLPLADLRAFQQEVIELLKRVTEMIDRNQLGGA
ncbi:MAG: ClpX C4-type zinc finger protein [Acidimicrobiales bacterium]